MRSLVTASMLLAPLAPAAARAEPFSSDDPNSGAMVRLFNDSQHVGVRSLMSDYQFPIHDASLALHWNNEQVAIPGITAPPGSQEAVDAITTASRPISGNAYQPYVKTRNEVTGALDRGNLGVDYYVSSEPDYLGQQIGARYSHDSHDQQLNLSFGTSYGWDDIRPLADDNNEGPSTKTTLHWNAVATDVVTPSTLVRLGLEYNVVEGLQHNPYRSVFAGGSIVPEHHPDHRQRRDLFLKVNQYLPARASLKFSYRFYDDDWGIDSHELGTKLSQYITHGIFARYEYRYYTQTPANFWREEYLTPTGVDGYLTGDYRMGPLSSHLFGFGLNADLAPLAGDSAWMRRLGAWFDYQRYFNSNNYSANILETGLDLRF
jgi:hypothetical protein